MVQYLRHGSVLAATSSAVGDWLEPDSAVSIPLALLTDSAWIWPSDLAHYVDRHAVEVPPEFVEPMAAERWRPRALSLSEMRGLESLLLENGE
jgi:hypothetical protein